MVNSGSFESSENDPKSDYSQLETNATTKATSPRHLIETCSQEEANLTATTAEMVSDTKPSPETANSENHIKKTTQSSTITTLIKPETKTSLQCSVPLHKVKKVIFEKVKKSEDNIKSPKRLLCLFCDRTFISQNLRQKHMDRCHSGGISRRFSSRTPGVSQSSAACWYCSKLNQTDHTLKELLDHLVTDHTNRYFACLPCEERFTSQSKLKEHNKIVHNIEDITDIGDIKTEVLERNINSSPETTARSSSRKRNNNKSPKLEIDTSNVSENLVDVKLINAKDIKEDSDSEDNLIKSSASKNNKNSKKVSVKSTKSGIKTVRTTRLQVKLLAKNKKRQKTNKKEPEIEKPISSKSVYNSSSVFSLVNLFTYKYEKIYDHASDSIKDANCGKFDAVFDKEFYIRTVSNIKENLLHHLDGKLNRNVQSENRISNFEQTPSETASKNLSINNYGSDVSLNAVTPVSLAGSSAYENFDVHIEYAAKATQKKKTKHDKNLKYNFHSRKCNFTANKTESDLTNLDMWTQLRIQERQRNVFSENDSVLPNQNAKAQREELNKILDKRGPFEDLRIEALEDLINNKNEDKFSSHRDVNIILEQILCNVFKTDENRTKSPLLQDNIKIEVDDVDLEIPNYLNLHKAPNTDEVKIDITDKPTMICIAQDSENQNVELTGEWARSRIYICATCAIKLPNLKALEEHKNNSHPHIYSTHYEFVGKQSEFYKHLGIPGLGKVGIIEMMPVNKLWLRSDARMCNKCAKVCHNLGELHRHILECGGDWQWMLARKKCKYRPYGARRRRQRGYKRTCNPDIPRAPREPRPKTAHVGPRPKPSDAETIQRMLANLPAKRNRKMISMRDGIQGPRKQYIRHSNLRSTSSIHNENSMKVNSQSQRILRTRISQATNQALKNSLKRKMNARVLRSRSAIIKFEEKEHSEDERIEIEKPVVLRRRITRTFNRVLGSKILDTNSSLVSRRKLQKSVIQNTLRTRLRSRLKEKISEEKDKKRNLRTRTEKEEVKKISSSEDIKNTIESVVADNKKEKTKKSVGKRLLSLVTSKNKKLKTDNKKIEETESEKPRKKLKVEPKISPKPKKPVKSQKTEKTETILEYNNLSAIIDSVATNSMDTYDPSRLANFIRKKAANLVKNVKNINKNTEKTNTSEKSVASKIIRTLSIRKRKKKIADNYEKDKNKVEVKKNSDLCQNSKNDTPVENVSSVSLENDKNGNKSTENLVEIKQTEETKVEDLEKMPTLEKIDELTPKVVEEETIPILSPVYNSAPPNPPPDSNVAKKIDFDSDAPKIENTNDTKEIQNDSKNTKQSSTLSKLKNKFKRSGKGLNDCIAMLRNKLEKVTEPLVDSNLFILNSCENRGPVICETNKLVEEKITEVQEKIESTKTTEKEQKNNKTVLEIPNLSKKLLNNSDFNINQQLTTVLDVAMKNCLLECVKSKCEELKTITTDDKPEKTKVIRKIGSIRGRKNAKDTKNKSEILNEAFIANVTHDSDEEDIPLSNLCNSPILKEKITKKPKPRAKISFEPVILNKTEPKVADILQKVAEVSSNIDNTIKIMSEPIISGTEKKKIDFSQIFADIIKSKSEKDKTDEKDPEKQPIISNKETTSDISWEVSRNSQDSAGASRNSPKVALKATINSSHEVTRKSLEILGNSPEVSCKESKVSRNSEKVSRNSPKVTRKLPENSRKSGTSLKLSQKSSECDVSETINVFPDENNTKLPEILLENSQNKEISTANVIKSLPNADFDMEDEPLDLINKTLEKSDVQLSSSIDTETELNITIPKEKTVKRGRGRRKNNRNVNLPLQKNILNENPTEEIVINKNKQVTNHRRQNNKSDENVKRKLNNIENKNNEKSENINLEKAEQENSSEIEKENIKNSRTNVEIENSSSTSLSESPNKSDSCLELSENLECNKNIQSICIKLSLIDVVSENDISTKKKRNRSQNKKTNEDKIINPDETIESEIIGSNVKKQIKRGKGRPKNIKTKEITTENSLVENDNKITESENLSEIVESQMSVVQKIEMVQGEVKKERKKPGRKPKAKPIFVTQEEIPVTNNLGDVVNMNNLTQTINVKRNSRNRVQNIIPEQKLFHLDTSTENDDSFIETESSIDEDIFKRPHKTTPKITDDFDTTSTENEDFDNSDTTDNCEQFHFKKPKRQLRKKSKIITKNDNSVLNDSSVDETIEDVFKKPLKRGRKPRRNNKTINPLANVVENIEITTENCNPQENKLEIMSAVVPENIFDTNKIDENNTKMPGLKKRGRKKRQNLLSVDDTTESESSENLFETTEEHKIISDELSETSFNDDDKIKVPKKRGRKKQLNVAPTFDDATESESCEILSETTEERNNLHKPDEFSEKIIKNDEKVEAPKKRGRKKQQTIAPPLVDTIESERSEILSETSEEHKKIHISDELGEKTTTIVDTPKTLGRKKRQNIAPTLVETTESEDSEILSEIAEKLHISDEFIEKVSNKQQSIAPTSNNTTESEISETMFETSDNEVHISAECSEPSKVDEKVDTPNKRGRKKQQNILQSPDDSLESEISASLFGNEEKTTKIDEKIETLNKRGRKKQQNIPLTVDDTLKSESSEILTEWPEKSDIFKKFNEVLIKIGPKIETPKKRRRKEQQKILEKVDVLPVTLEKLENLLISEDLSDKSNDNNVTPKKWRGKKQQNIVTVLENASKSENNVIVAETFENQENLLTCQEFSEKLSITDEKINTPKKRGRKKQQNVVPTLNDTTESEISETLFETSENEIIFAEFNKNPIKIDEKIEIPKKRGRKKQQNVIPPLVDTTESEISENLFETSENEIVFAEFNENPTKVDENVETPKKHTHKKQQNVIQTSSDTLSRIFSEFQFTRSENVEKPLISEEICVKLTRIDEKIDIPKQRGRKKQKNIVPTTDGTTASDSSEILATAPEKEENLLILEDLNEKPVEIKIPKKRGRKKEQINILPLDDTLESESNEILAEMPKKPDNFEELNELIKIDDKVETTKKRGRKKQTIVQTLDETFRLEGSEILTITPEKVENLPISKDFVEPLTNIDDNRHGRVKWQDIVETLDESIESERDEIVPESPNEENLHISEEINETPTKTKEKIDTPKKRGRKKQQNIGQIPDYTFESESNKIWLQAPENEEKLLFSEEFNKKPINLDENLDSPKKRGRKKQQKIIPTVDDTLDSESNQILPETSENEENLLILEECSENPTNINEKIDSPKKRGGKKQQNIVTPLDDTLESESSDIWHETSENEEKLLISEEFSENPTNIIEKIDAPKKRGHKKQQKINRKTFELNEKSTIFDNVVPEQVEKDANNISTPKNHNYKPKNIELSLDNLTTPESCEKLEEYPKTSIFEDIFEKPISTIDNQISDSGFPTENDINLIENAKLNPVDNIQVKTPKKRGRQKKTVPKIDKIDNPIQNVLSIDIEKNDDDSRIETTLKEKMKDKLENQEEKKYILESEIFEFSDITPEIRNSEAIAENIVVQIKKPRGRSRKKDKIVENSVLLIDNSDNTENENLIQKLSENEEISTPRKRGRKRATFSKFDKTNDSLISSDNSLFESDIEQKIENLQNIDNVTEIQADIKLSEIVDEENLNIMKNDLKITKTKRGSRKNKNIESKIIEKTENNKNLFQNIVEPQENLDIIAVNTKTTKKRGVKKNINTDMKILDHFVGSIVSFDENNALESPSNTILDDPLLNETSTSTFEISDNFLEDSLENSIDATIEYVIKMAQKWNESHLNFDNTEIKCKNRSRKKINNTETDNVTENLEKLQNINTDSSEIFNTISDVTETFDIIENDNHKKRNRKKPTQKLSENISSENIKLFDELFDYSNEGNLEDKSSQKRNRKPKNGTLNSEIIDKSKSRVKISKNSGTVTPIKIIISNLTESTPIQKENINLDLTKNILIEDPEILKADKAIDKELDILNSCGLEKIDTLTPITKISKRGNKKQKSKKAIDNIDSESTINIPEIKVTDETLQTKILEEMEPMIHDVIEIPKTPSINMGASDSEDEIPLSFLSKPTNDETLDISDNLETPILPTDLIENNIPDEEQLIEDLINDKDISDKIDETILDFSYDIIDKNDKLLSDINRSIEEVLNEENKDVELSEIPKTPTLVDENDDTNVEKQATDFITTPDLNNTSLVIKIQKKLNCKIRKPKKGRKKGPIKIVPNIIKKTEEKLLCQICNKTFTRLENLVKHKRTLTHISKLSEIEAQENQNQQKDEIILETSEKEKLEDLADVEEFIQKEEETYPVILNKTNIKLVDIITDVLDKPTNDTISESVLSKNIPSANKSKRYKSMAERKSFDSDTYINTPQKEEIQSNQLIETEFKRQSNNQILSKQLTLLENFIEKTNPDLNYIEDISYSSNNFEETIPVRNLTGKDLFRNEYPIKSQIKFSHNNDLISSFIKPDGHFTHFENSKVQKPVDEDTEKNNATRKKLNRDEELFLECCSLLKSGSEISNSKKSSKQNYVNDYRPNNFIQRDLSWFAQSSRVETPIGEPYVNNDWSNSNSAVSSEWLAQKAASPDQPVENNTLSKKENNNSENFSNIDFEDISLDSSLTNTQVSNDKVKESVPLDFHHVQFVKPDDPEYVIKNPEEKKEKNKDVIPEEADENLKRHVVSAFGGLMAKALKCRMKAVVRRSQKAKEKRTFISALQPVITDYVKPMKKIKIIPEILTENSKSSDGPKKIVTKGAMKIFEGIKVSIPTQDLDLKEVLKSTTIEQKEVAEYIEQNDTKSIKNTFKNFGNKLGLKETKRKNNKKKNSEDIKSHDIYDFEESEDSSSQIKTKSLTIFRNICTENKPTETGKNTPRLNDSESETDRYYDSISFEENSVSSESIENSEEIKLKETSQKSLSKKDNQKKCMIMGRIFKNASKPKLEDKIPEIRDISSEENTKIIETYLDNYSSLDNVDSTAEENNLTITNAKNKMTKGEMDLLFDKLLNENPNLVSNDSEIHNETIEEIKQKPKVIKTKKRRHNSDDSASDEFFLSGKGSKSSKKHKKHPRKPNVKKQNGGINLEQEMKECIGVAGRKSQRKCTSGKQNVLVEYWSSDESVDYVEIVRQSEILATKSTEIGSDKKPDINDKIDLYEFLPDFDEVEEPIIPLHPPKEVPDTIKFEKPKKISDVQKSHQSKEESDIPHKPKRKPGHRKKRNLSEGSNADTLANTRRKRNAVETLYYWSSTSDDETENLIEVKPIREDTEEERPMQHGWIVGDSPKKLVTMLAQAKGHKKLDCESVKEQNKKSRTTM